ncbi:MAG: ATP-dependent DNA helicase RecG [Lachnospiraceae bacterium]|nr:ATP-dependent DNA helicase RecG [Lachnospiraceae bacterium]
MDFSTPIAERKGVGEKTKALLYKLGVYTVGDILLYFPRTYIEYPELSLVGEAEKSGIYAFCITPRKSVYSRSARTMNVSTLTEVIDGKSFSCVWFRKPYISKQLKPNVPAIIYGKAEVGESGVKMEQPKVFTLDEYKRLRSSLQPVYNLTSGLTNNFLSKVLRGIFDDLTEECGLYPSLDEKAENFEYIKNAFITMHFPKNILELSKAREHFVYDEFFWFILRMQYGKAKSFVKNALLMNDSSALDYAEKLPYELTGAQKRTLDEVLSGFRGENVTQKLIQGDVGSGKTAIAYFAMLDMHLNGYQSVLMAPTEVLANQHYESFIKMNEDLGVKAKVILLTGSTKGEIKKSVYKEIQENPDAMIIGTHALFWKSVNYNNLGLVITDEQHRFGVKQRKALFEKGDSPHILVMSATPIPRTLGMIIYGDMDICVIDEMPKGRIPIKNALIPESDRMKAYAFMKKEIKKGHQVYVICPFVEASESIDGENVEDYSTKLAELFKDEATVGMLHGKMPNDMKNNVMEAFSKGETDILVSTTVVEVGVNVPNATVMVIENANRFGLASLHQLRGRVGRGADESYCVFIADLEKKNAKERLEILVNSNDGFKIASEDLKMRGPGDFLGIRQSGDMNFKLADIYQDADVLKRASKDIENLLKDDPDLTNHKDIYDYLLYLKDRNNLIL